MKYLSIHQYTKPVSLWVLLGLTLIALMVIASPALGKGKPGPGADPTIIRITSAGPISTLGPGHVQCEEKLGADSTSLLCNKADDGFVIGNEILVGVGKDCFGAGYTPGAIHLLYNSDESGETLFRFHGPDRNGNDILYVLETLAPDGWDGDFPPALAGTVIAMVGQGWILRASNNRQAKYACLGGGADLITVTLERMN